MSQSDGCIKFKFSRDTDRIMAIALHDEIGSYLLPDAELMKKHQGILKTEVAATYIFSKNGVDVGLACVFMPPGSGIGIVDVGFIKTARGRPAKVAAIASLNDFLEHYPNIKLCSKLLKDNKRALGFNRMCGFSKVNEDDEYYYMRYKHGDGNGDGCNGSRSV